MRCTCPVPPTTRISGEFDEWGVYWNPKAASGPNKGKGQHKGLDFACAIGTEVRAIAGGKVVQAGVSETSGKMVVVDHGGGRSSSYHHLSEILVLQGAKVHQGQVIARSGDTGSNCHGAHLHITVRDAARSGENRLDPRPWVLTPYADIGPEHWGLEDAKWAKGVVKGGLVAGDVLDPEAPLSTIRTLAILRKLFPK